ncbi:MAG TPA: zinc ABC transporter substrate-binding protein, partial [Actinotalea sp.]|nr:zinc ABC transporter substrate-binding protein [Actinotalea sp.]
HSHEGEDHSHEGEGEDHSAEGDVHDHDHGDYDPHTWLSIDQLPVLVTAVADALAEIEPASAQEFAANAEALNARLADLDEAYRTGLASCERDTVVITHPAFGYVTHAYGLQQVGISGFDEDTEPSPERVAQVATIAQESGATTIFLADTSSPKVAEVLAAELNLETAVLSSILGGDGGDYVEQAEANLAALTEGLGCS